MNPIADRQCARVETKGPTVTAGESLSAAVGLEVPLAQLCAMDRLRRLRDKLLVLNSSDDEYNLTDQDEHDLLRLVEERMAGGWRHVNEGTPNGYLPVLIWSERKPEYGVRQGYFDRGLWISSNGSQPHTTHWQHLPAPPAVKGV